ncbi:MAG: hypothetical protein N2314_01565 [Brevinematales bacterium]|nr:hypothetical protein [Brevinematales bacterium]
MKKKWETWDRRLIQTVIRSATKHYLRERLGKTEDENVEIGIEYPILKNLLGVQVEEGVLRIVHVSERFFQAFLQDLVGVHKVSGHWQCVGTNDVTVVQHWIERLGLEPLDTETVGGYVLNHELVEWIEEPFSGIQMRYRSGKTKLLVLYKMFFLISDSGIYIIIEKLS